MKTTAFNNRSFTDAERREKRSLQRNRRRWTASLFASAALGLLVGAVGLVISALAFCGFLSRHETVGRLGTLMVVLAFPLMLFGAHAMDKIAESDRLFKASAQDTEKRRLYQPEQWNR